MHNERPELDEQNEQDDLEAKLAEQQEADPTPNDILRGELEAETEEPEEKTEADLRVEAEEKLTVPEQRWLDELEHRAKDWKHDATKQPFSAQKAIRKLKIEDFTPDDIELFRLFRCLQKSPNSLYFKQKFGQTLRKQQRETRNDGGTSFQLTKVLEAMQKQEQE